VRLFRDCGEIEKVYFRSIAVEQESKLPMKAKYIMNRFGKEKDSKNAYIVFKAKEAAEKAAAEKN